MVVAKLLSESMLRKPGKLIINQEIISPIDCGYWGKHHMESELDNRQNTMHLFFKCLAKWHEQQCFTSWDFQQHVLI